MSGYAGALPAGGGVPPFHRRPRSRKGKKRMLKCFDPKETFTFVSPLAPDTEFTFRAMSGPVVYFGLESLSTLAVNKFVTKVTNIEILEMVETEVDGKKVKTAVRKEYAEFIPAEHPEIRLSDQLPFQVANPLFDAIWDKSSLTKKEAGE